MLHPAPLMQVEKDVFRFGGAEIVDPVKTETEESGNDFRWLWEGSKVAKCVR